MGSPYLDSAETANMHRKLNAIYELAKNTNKCIRRDVRFCTSFGFFAGHYIRLEGKQERQSYPLPVITVEGMGEIGFNLDSAWFEFFLASEALIKADIRALIGRYNVEIYDESSENDFYSEGCSAEDVLANLEASGGQTVGVAVYSDECEPEKLKESFLEVCGLLGL